MYIPDEAELGRFQWECIENRRINARCCLEQKVIKQAGNKYYYEGKEIFSMTPQEELFAKLFNHEKVLVKDMDLLTLRAHREELAKIAFEARARLTAVDDEERVRSKKERGQGFSRSLQMDDASSEAINSIKERQGKLTKMEKIQQDMMTKLGIDPETAARITSNSAIADLKAKKAEVNPFEPKVIPPESGEVKPEPNLTKALETIMKPSEEPKKPFVNPFAVKKDN